MTDMEPNDQDEFAGFEDVIAFIEGLAVRPAESVQAAQVQMAAAAASGPAVRFLRRRPRSKRPAIVKAFRRGAAALVAAVLGVSGLAAAGVLPEDVQNAVAGLAQLVGVSLPAPPATSLSTPSGAEPDIDSEIGDEQSTTPPDPDPSPSQPLSSDDECAVSDDETEEGVSSDSEEGDHETEAPCSEADDESDEGDGDNTQDQTAEPRDDEDDEETDDSGGGDDETDGDEEDEEAEADD